MPMVKREKEMDVPVAKLYRAITEFEAYPQFLPEVVSAKVAPGPSAERRLVTFELEVMKRFSYTLDFSLTDNREAAWKLAESNFFKTNSGRWFLTPISESRTHVLYELDVSFGFLVPGWVSRKLTEVSLPKMFDGFEKRAQG